MADFVRKVSELGHPLVSVLQDQNGPLDISPGSTVRVTVKAFGQPSRVDAPASVVSPAAPIDSPDRGKVMYTELTADVSADGIYEVTWWLTRAGEQEVPYPEGQPLTLLVLPD